MAYQVTQSSSPNTYVGPLPIYERRQETTPRLDRQTLTAVIWTLFSFATFFVALRLTLRWRHNKRFLFDDCWMITAWLCLLTQFSLQMLELRAFFGVSIDASDEAVRELLRWHFPVVILFWTCLWSVKASFLAAFYNLVYPVRGIRYAWYAVAVLSALGYIGCWTFVLLICSNPADIFRPGACVAPHQIAKQHTEAAFSTTIDVVCDLMIMALPLSVLPMLLLTRSMKLGIGAAFCIGLFIVVVAILRATQVSHGKTDIVGLAIWGAVETSTAIIVGSLLPICGALVSRVRRMRSLGRRQLEEDGGDHRLKTSRQASYSLDEPLGNVLDLEAFGNDHTVGDIETGTDRDDSSRDGDATAIIRHGSCKEGRI